MTEKFKIQGGETLKGEVSIGGAKNSVLKLLAAAILVKGCTKIYNVPQLTDVTIMLQVLSELGAKLDYNKEEKPSFDYSKVVVGVVVTHAKFGDGTIINIDKAQKYIKIKFAVGEKMFIFDAFEKGFLKIK